MGYRLSKITTRTGDDGKTSLGKGRLFKDHARIEALGSLDELNSVIGMVITHCPQDQEIINTLKQVQQDLFDVGGELCPPYRTAVTDEKIAFLDEKITTWNATLPPLKEFILPGGNIKSATCHLARTVCRRAERHLVTLHQGENLNPNILRYINRLSDVLFIAARLLARETENKEDLWHHERNRLI